MKKVKEIRRSKVVQSDEEIEEEVGDMNDIPCVDCLRTYPLVPGSSNCRCKRCNALFKHNQEVKFQSLAKKI